MSFALFHCCVVFFFNASATTEIYTLSLHDALPIWLWGTAPALVSAASGAAAYSYFFLPPERSEEHTSELQSHSDLVCRLLLEKKKKSNPSNLSHAAQ